MKKEIWYYPAHDLILAVWIKHQWENASVMYSEEQTLMGQMKIHMLYRHCIYIGDF